MKIQSTITKILDENTLYGDIFPNSSLDEIKSKYKEYCKILHPDVCKDLRADRAFSQLQVFYKQAKEAIQNNTWIATNYIEVSTKKETTLKIKYQYHCRFELGDYYVCNKVIIYIFDDNREKYYNNFIKQVNNLKYADRKMEKIFKNLFPKIQSISETTSGKKIVVLSKTEDIFPLKCLIENGFNRNLPHTHLAWITSRLMNIACYLKWSGLVSNGIDIDNLFVSPHYHSILLFGGWWYTTKANEAMIGTTKNIFNVMTPKVKANKVSDYTTDIESIRAIGRAYAAGDAPSAILNFYNEGSTNDSMKEMKKWDDALQKGYGVRRFVKINDNIINNIYKKGN